MREPGSRSRCPAHYSRPRVLVVRSPRARGARSGLLARYVGGHLALGGYADVDVRPWRDDAAPPPEEAAAPPADAPVKDLRAFLARRGAPTPRGAAEKADLRAACAAAAGLPRVVAWGAGVATTRGEVLGRADLRLHENRPDAPLAAACDLVLVCVAGDDAAGCGAFLAKSLATREGIVPVLHLACEPGNHLPAFEAAFSDAARPLPDAAAPRPLAGPVVVAGALLLEVGVRRTDGALVQLGGRGIALERLDAERADAGLGKFYDLVSTAGLPLVFERRARLARLAWGHALLYAPLLAAHAACGGALPAGARDRGRRRARGAARARGRRRPRGAARGARGARGRRARARAAPTPVCARRAWVVLYGAAALEAAVALAPAWLWRAWIAPRVLGFPAGADAPETPGEMDARAGVDGAGVLVRARGCVRPGDARGARGAAARAPGPAGHARARRRRAALRGSGPAARRLLRGAARARGGLAAAVALMLLAGGACEGATSCTNAKDGPGGWPCSVEARYISHAMALSISCPPQI